MDDFEIYNNFLIRKITNGLLILSPIIGVVFYVLNRIDWFAFFNFAISTPIVIIAIHSLFKSDAIRQKFSVNSLKILELSVLAVYPITSFGALYGFKNIYNYDNFVHFTTSFVLMFVFLVLILLAFIDKINTSLKWRLIATLLFFGIFFGGFLWEYFQEYSDFYLGTKMFTDVIQLIDIDVLYDITSDGAGALLAALAIIIFEKRIKNLLLKSAFQVRG